MRKKMNQKLYLDTKSNKSDGKMCLQSENFNKPKGNHVNKICYKIGYFLSLEVWPKYANFQVNYYGSCDQ
jgi:hypothetical protein